MSHLRCADPASAADHHYTPDERIVQLLITLLSPSRGVHYSLADIGAGVGQMCAALQSRDAELSCASYDGAGNVENTTQSFVQWIDLTRPLALPRADWVVSLEVGEHVPNQFEPMLVRNLHSMNCRGLLLSWGRYNGRLRGHGDANYHYRSYLVDLFSQLGYRHIADLAPSYLQKPLRPRHFWFDTNMVGVFERVQPLNLSGCTLDGSSSAVFTDVQ